MAAALAAVNVDRPLEATGAGWEFTGTLTLSGSYTTGGDAASLIPFFSQQGQGIVDYVPPIYTGGGYVIRYNYGISTWQVFQGDNASGAAGPGVELGAGAYPASLTAAPFRVTAKGR
jgi:hypothetical protein